jgi:hypothetical protein
MSFKNCYSGSMLPHLVVSSFSGLRSSSRRGDAVPFSAVRWKLPYRQVRIVRRLRGVLPGHLRSD